ncbi:S8 family serine peptidase [Rufibacter latericius]|nr:S8 family serine peptidase [Rufibacter latericius]
MRKSAQVRVQVKDQKQFLAWIKTALPQIPVHTTSLSQVYFLEKINPKNLETLAQSPWVEFIDVPNRKAREEAYLQNADLRVNRVEALHLQYPDLHGQNLVVSVKEQPFDSTDIDFKARVLPSSGFTQLATPHATSMATLIAGAGNTSSSSRGVAWQSRLTAADFSNLLPDNTDLLKTQGVSVQNHSYGVGVENYYGLESQAYDQQSRQLPALLHVFSSGNSGSQAAEEGPYAKISGFANLTGQFKVSKNTLSVGAIDTSGQVSMLSSKGPTYDGRIKPELVAFGEAGTSEAASVVSGIALVVQDAYRRQNGGAFPPSALVKAALINSADDKGRPEVDYAAGFGNADALGAVQSVLDKRYATGEVTQATTRTLRFKVPAGTAKVKVTLVWQDREGSPSAEKALIQDLDLSLKSVTTGKKWLPWGLSTFAHKDSLLAPARRQADHLNNVEQVTVSNPGAGEYEVQVSGFKVEGAQEYSVVYEVEKAFSWGYPTTGSQLESGQKNRLRWILPVKDGAKGKLEFKWAGAGAEWQTLGENIPLSAEAFDVAFPDTIALAQMRMVVGNEIYGTGQFMIGPTLSLKVGYQCGDEFMLFWPKTQGADGYQVYALGPQYLEPVAQTADTVMAFQKSQHPGLLYAVAPLVNGKPGQRSLTLDYTQQGVGCYIISFLPRHFVSDSVILDLQISTVFGIEAMYLEKKVAGAFQPIQTLEVGQQTRFVLQDVAPLSGKNEYRVKMVTNTGNTFYSPEESLFYTPANYIQVYPNPNLAGGELNIITQDDGVNTIFLYDQMGRLIREYSQDGSIKVIDTKGISPGAYFVKVFSSAGALTQAKVILL